MVACQEKGESIIVRLCKYDGNLNIIACVNNDLFMSRLMPVQSIYTIRSCLQIFLSLCPGADAMIFFIRHGD